MTKGYNAGRAKVSRCFSVVRFASSLVATASSHCCDPFARSSVTLHYMYILDLRILIQYVISCQPPERIVLFAVSLFSLYLMVITGLNFHLMD